MKQQTIILTTLEAIYQRRSVRSYTDQALDRATILTLLEAAVQAPTAMHEEPWAFSVVQDRALLARLSDAARETNRLGGHIAPPHAAPDGPDNLFHNAGTLIVIWGKKMGPFVTADCWLAAENLMLAGCSMGLGSCVIGCVVGTLNSLPWKSDLGAREDLTAIAPIIVGRAAAHVAPVTREPVEILSWHKAN
jgi:nitroreductase